MGGRISLIVRRIIGAPHTSVFDAWTRPDQLRRWWGQRPMTCEAAEVDLRIGGTYRVANELPDGTVRWILGRFEVIERPRRLVYTWSHADCPPPEPLRVAVRFVPVARGTEVLVVHERIDGEAPYTDHEKSWRGCLDNLAAMFARA